MSFLIAVLLTGTLYCVGKTPPLNIPPVVDKPPVGLVTKTLNSEEIVPDPEEPLTEDHVAQFNFEESQRGLAGPLTCTKFIGH